jgi:hypothetical protein
MSEQSLTPALTGKFFIIKELYLLLIRKFPGKSFLKIDLCFLKLILKEKAIQAPVTLKNYYFHPVFPLTKEKLVNS